MAPKRKTISKIPSSAPISKKSGPDPIDMGDAEVALQELGPSEITEDKLNEAVIEGYLPEQACGGWQVPTSPRPFPEHRQLVLFKSFFDRGLGLPCCSFVRGLLFFYGINLIHLNPNSILHISIFIHLCEAFLGVLPHFDLFRSLFYLRPLPKLNDRCCIGGAGFQLRSANAYLDVSLLDNVKHWRREWFYIDNHMPSIEEFTTSIADPKPSWSDKPQMPNADVTFLLKKIADLKAAGVDGAMVACNFIARRIQPWKRQIKPQWLYTSNDPMREIPDPQNVTAVVSRLNRLLANVGDNFHKGKDHTYNARSARYRVLSSLTIFPTATLF